MKYRALFIVLAFFPASNRWLQAAAAVTTTDVTAGTALSATTHNTNFGNVRTALNKLNPNGWANGGTDIGYTDGKMGIGIGVPLALLHLSAGAANTKMLFEDMSQAADQKLWRIGNYNGGKFSVDATSDSQGIVTNVLTLTRVGRVGIGSINPAANLHIVGDLQVQQTATNGAGTANMTGDVANLALMAHGSAYGGTLYGISRNNMVLLEAQSGGAIVVGTSNTAPVLFGPNRTERMRIDNSGNVGIGATSPGAKLHVTQTGGTSGDGLRLTAGATN